MWCSPLGACRLAGGQAADRACSVAQPERHAGCTGAARPVHGQQHAEHQELLSKIVESGSWDDDTESAFKTLLENFKSTQTW